MICEVTLVLSSEKNLYEILEISPDASAVTIKSAYRKLARKYHPDLNGGAESCVKKFKEISEAYEILSDADKKKNYDILRGFYKETHSHTKYKEANRAYSETIKEEPKPKDESFSNIFNDILDGFKRTTSSSAKQQFKGKQVRPQRGTDVYADVVISILEAVEGTVRTINILHSETCPNCEGRPFLNGQCPVCGGLGEQSSHKKLTVTIPANVKNGSKIRIANEGNKGYNGGKNGDLYLNIKIENSPKFKYDGLNVLYNVAIEPFEAALGASIDIPSPNGKISMKVTPNTHSGQKFRLSGQGLQQDGKKGDMIVTVNIEIPKNLSGEEIELYKKLKNASKGNVRENQ